MAKSIYAHSRRDIQNETRSSPKTKENPREVRRFAHRARLHQAQLGVPPERGAIVCERTATGPSVAVSSDGRAAGVLENSRPRLAAATEGPVAVRRGASSGVLSWTIMRTVV